MVANVKSIKFNTQGEKICKDGDRWICRVDTAGGYGIFSIKEYGSSAKALNACRAFHAKMERQKKKDKEYFDQHGEKPHRNALNIRNRSGYTGIAKSVFPNLNGKPNIVYTATWVKGGRQFSEYFSSAQYGTEKEALDAALLKRAEMVDRFYK